MFTSGIPQETIDSLSVDDVRKLTFAYQKGAFGELGRARRDYINYCMLHNLTQVLISVNSKKGYRAKKPIPFEEYEPHMHEYITGESPEQRWSRLTTPLTAEEAMERLHICPNSKQELKDSQK